MYNSAMYGGIFLKYKKDELYKMDKNFTYRDRKINEISFPLGGIGTGSIGLAGNGRLVDWEIFNKPQKNGSVNGFSFFAIKAEDNEGLITARVLNSDINPPYTGNGHSDWTYGFGVKREYMTGLPHFKKSEFYGEFPIAKIKFIDEKIPLNVELEAFNPFIPLNDMDSSIPCAIFIFKVTNEYEKKLNISLAGNIGNPFLKGAVNKYFDKEGFRGIKLYSKSYTEDEPEYGDITLSTDIKDTSYQSYWYRGNWFDNLTVFWKDFIAHGKFKDRNYDQPSDNENWNATVNFKDVALLCCHRSLEPGQSETFKFIISWNYPNFTNYWNPGGCSEESGIKKLPQWKNYYATLFKDSKESAAYIWTNFERLYMDTLKFKRTLFKSSLPDYVLNAIASNLSTLKSPTCIRLTDGTLYGFEGCNYESGCCEGSCTHVWNYAQSMAFLFPVLERSMRDIDYNTNQLENGKMIFRMLLPPGREGTVSAADPIAEHGKAAVDGQMGGIIKTYREWKISGDTEWLRHIWPKVIKAMEYAWDPTNEEWWDKDYDGVIEGIQHHTLDVEMYGPNSYLTGYYLCALLAASKMADVLGEKDSKKYFELYEKGQTWVNENLFNGKYFCQKIDLKDERFPIDQELGEIKYQIGEGCHIDQVIGQWYAHIVGIGYIFDQGKVRKALESIYKNNFMECIGDFANTYRVYALNSEEGLVICTWPEGNSPKVPVPYSGECMNGFEYQASCHMIYEGLIDEGLSVVKAVRDRYDGEKRNPWNEFECGSNYARSMASYSLLLALSGFEYDMVNGHIGFNPKINKGGFYCFWSLGTAWGSFEIRDKTMIISVLYGSMGLNTFSCNLLEGKKVEVISLQGKTVNFYCEGKTVVFESKVVISCEMDIRINFK